MTRSKLNIINSDLRAAISSLNISKQAPTKHKMSLGGIFRDVKVNKFGSQIKTVCWISPEVLPGDVVPVFFSIAGSSGGYGELWKHCIGYLQEAGVPAVVIAPKLPRKWSFNKLELVKKCFFLALQTEVFPEVFTDFTYDSDRIYAIGFSAGACALMQDCFRKWGSGLKVAAALVMSAGCFIDASDAYSQTSDENTALYIINGTKYGSKFSCFADGYSYAGMPFLNDSMLSIYITRTGLLDRADVVNKIADKQYVISASQDGHNVFAFMYGSHSTAKNVVLKSPDHGLYFGWMLKLRYPSFNY